MYRHILIPTDGSELAERAVAHGLPLARMAEARVTIMTVVEPFHLLTVDAAQLQDTAEAYRQHARERADRLLGRAAEKARAVGVACETIQTEDNEPFRAIIDVAAIRTCDLIVMASHGRRGIAAIVLGSQTVKVLTHSTIPVLICR